MIRTLSHNFLFLPLADRAAKAAEGGLLRRGGSSRFVYKRISLKSRARAPRVCAASVVACMCVKPLNAWYNALPNSDSGKRSLHFKPSLMDIQRAPDGDVSVPCGKCIGCKKDRSTSWVRRMQIQMLTCPSATYITLTYRPEDLPPHPSKYHIQTFVKRLRMASRDYGVVPFTFKYFIASEHGDETFRIHYHGILFGVDMMRDPKWKAYLHHFTSKGYPVYTSPVLEKIWSHGFVSLDVANTYSIKYIADYITQSVFDDDIRLFSQGIGVDYFCKYRRNNRNRLETFDLKLSARQLCSLGEISLPSPRGRDPVKVRMPSFLLRYLEKHDPALYDSVKSSRREFAASSRRGSLSDYGDYLTIQKERTIKEKVLHNA